MALRDQPYLPLYVKDFMNDSKLKECDAQSWGVYISIMCLMHQSEEYGTILLEQKYQQMFQQNSQRVSKICSGFVEAFAHKLLRYLPFTLLEIEESICQLIENKVLYIEGHRLCQKRMVKDGKSSLGHSIGGKASAAKGGGVKNFVGKLVGTNDPTKSSTNFQQNTVIVIDDENKEEKERVLLSTRGVQGAENSGEGKETPFAGNGMGPWYLEWDLDDCKKYYFSESYFDRARSDTLKILYVWFSPDNPDEVIERLELWAEKFNVFLHRTTGPKKSMATQNGWPNHFHNWLGSQKSKLKNIPKDDAKDTGNHKVKLSEIDQAIENAGSKEEKYRLQLEKYNKNPD